MHLFAIWLCLSIGNVLSRPENLHDVEADIEKHMHPFIATRRKRSVEDSPEAKADYWIQSAQNVIQQKLAYKLNTRVAKNVILFLGDGMSIPTISAARVYMGGEEKKLAFEKFPFTGFSKTYCVNMQVPDSACTATAYLRGVKGNLGTIGVTAAVERRNCSAMIDPANQVSSIADWAQLQGKKTGIVTTTRVTHASPAGVYAHTAERDWESDANVVESEEDPHVCWDIAKQLIFGHTGQKLNVILGGGRTEFIPKEYKDEEELKGSRLDKANLIDKWLELKKEDNKTAQYVWNRDQLLNVQNNIEYLLGLFESSHMQYNLDRNKTTDPSLEEMTQKAIEILSQSEEGYFLFVEGGRIDTAHHETKAQKALDETSEFSKAIDKAVSMTGEDTLIVVTSDHAHTMSFSGYPERGSNIFGIAGKATDSLPMSILTYANGPGYRKPRANGERHDISSDDMNDVNYEFPSNSPMVQETHGGDDVGIFAKGPWAHLFSGVMEENVIAHLMAFASCVGQGVTACDINKEYIS